MVQIQVDLTDEQSKILGILKLVWGLNDKGEVIKKLVDKEAVIANVLNKRVKNA
jgi:hypothetical protein